MDAQIVHRLQAGKQAKEQCQSFKTDRHANQLTQPPQQNRQYLSSGQVRSN